MKKLIITLLLINNILAFSQSIKLELVPQNIQNIANEHINDFYNLYVNSDYRSKDAIGKFRVFKMESDNSNGYDYFFLNDINTKGGSPFFDDYYCGQFIYYDKYSKNYKWQIQSIYWSVLLI